MRRYRSRPTTDLDPDIDSVAIRLLTRRDYTVVELERKLEERGYGDEAVAGVIDKFKRSGQLNDRRVGAAFVRTASRIKGRGKLRIARELEARGVDRALVRELTSELSAGDESDAIAKMLARMRVTLPLPADERRRVFGRLLRRGFSAEAIAKALRATPDDE